MHDLPRLAGLHNQANPGANAFAYQVVVHGRGCQQAGDGCVAAVHAPVRQNDNGAAGRHGLSRLAAQTLDCALQCAGALARIEEHGAGGRAQPADGDVPHLLQVCDGQDGLLQLQLAAVLRGLLEQVLLGADERLQRGHQLLPYGVQRRVGYLSEELLEVVEQHLGLVGKHGQGRVVAHRAHRLGAGYGHRLHQHVQVLERVAEGALQAGERVPAHRLRGGYLRKQVQVHAVVSEPLIIGLAPGKRLLQLLVVNYARFLGVQQEHAAGVYPVLEAHLLRWHVQDAHLGGHDQHIGLGDQVPERPQPVAVQHDAYALAVRGSDERRAVPRLHQAGVVLVEVALILWHVHALARCLRDHHHEGVRKRAAGCQQKLQRVVEARGVAGARGDDWEELLHVVAEQGRREHGLPGGHPVDVASERVYLPVVAD